MTLSERLIEMVNLVNILDGFPESDANNYYVYAWYNIFYMVLKKGVSVNQKITHLLNSQNSVKPEFKKELFDSLHLLLNGNYVKYNIENNISSDKSFDLSDDTFQKILYKLNEKSEGQKLKGVYYTSSDVSNYIIYNALITSVLDSNDRMYNEKNGNDLLSSLDAGKLNKVIFETSLIDPTCGTGEFMSAAFDIKIKLLTKYNDDDLIKICKTIYGNDIDDESVDISKIRIFFKIARLLTEKRSFKILAKTLNNQFFTEDFICNESPFNKKFDIVIGNPPYVEYRVFSDKTALKNNFGNIYADAIKNSINILRDNGALGFIIPLSYISTSRMEPIREFVKENTASEFILSFADRPDCLFDGVHQKLNILIAKKNDVDQHHIYSSNYKHWYSSERKDLLNGCAIILNDFNTKKFLPKLGNEIEKTIFEKIFTIGTDNILHSQDMLVTKDPIFLNMRACFWIKAFSFNPGSSEYKPLHFSPSRKDFILCLLNSSLFWLYWTIVSDCWHITSKELAGFRIPGALASDENFKKLYNKLEKKLENTKKHVGSKQTEYEYKHKYCKDVIDEIDNEIAKIYGLNNKELDYVKNFALKYRIGINE